MQQLTLAYQNMVVNNLNRLKSIARSYSKNEDREDLFQEILYQLWRGYQSFENKSQLDTWVYRVALNTAISYVRKEKTQPQLVSGNNLNWVEPHHDGEFQDSVEILEKFLSQLNKIDRAIMMLYLDDIKQKQISEITGQSTNVISVRINRMKQKFQQLHVE